MESIIHYVEDLQFACFAVVFAIMALQNRKDRTIRYVCASYLLATLVSVIDVTLPHPYRPLTNACILTILSLRYAVLAAGLVYFTRASQWPTFLSSSITVIAACLTALSFTPLAGPRQLSFYYALLFVQQVLLAVLVLRSSEVATRIPRSLLTLLFLMSAAYRVVQYHFVLSHHTPRDLWWRDLGLFLNGTVLSGLLPFTIVWMMNERAHNTLLEQSLLDPLTNLLNRRGLAEAAHRELGHYHRNHRDFAVAIVDIDHFKRWNDRHGHAFGDRVLQRFSALAKEMLRQSDAVARTGGEEFTLLLPVTSGREAEQVIERLRARFQETLMLTPSETEESVTFSAGVTWTEGRAAVEWDDLLHEADSAVYAAKHAGRNRIILHKISPGARTEVLMGGLPL